MTDKIPASQSEDNGIACLTEKDLQVYSVGISTGGVAEMRMARLNPARHIIATTIDEQGLVFAKEKVREAGLDAQITCKIENVSELLPYDDNHFDYIYARLVLHYLPKQALDKTLAELRRILKPGGKLFVVVRSVDCPDAKLEGAKFDPVTHITKVYKISASTGKLYDASRYFHTTDSIKDHISKAGFSVEYVKKYDEQLYSDFMRTVLAKDTDNVIELLAHK